VPMLQIEHPRVTIGSLTHRNTQQGIHRWTILVVEISCIDGQTASRGPREVLKTVKAIEIQVQ
jgi:hypothetical protein